MTEKSLDHENESALLKEIEKRANAALVSNDGLSREQSIRGARVAVERVRRSKMRR